MPETTQSQTFNASAAPAQQGAGGKVFPANIVAAVHDAAAPATQDTFAAYLAAARADEAAKGRDPAQPLPLLNSNVPDFGGPALDIAKSKALVIAALRGFDENLAARAEAVINDPDRMILRRYADVPRGEIRQCQCQPAETKDNPGSQAVVRYDYDNTVNDAVFLAHELGHAVADDCLRDAGFRDSDAKRHIQEVQSFLFQQILYEHLAKGGDEGLALAARKHASYGAARMLFHFPIAEAAAEAAGGKIPDTDKILTRWLGDDWGSYARADTAFRTIAQAQAPDRETAEKADEYIKGRIEYLGDHPMGHMTALMLYGRLKDAAPDDPARKAIGLLYGLEGPKDANEVLKAAGLGDPAALQAAARSAVQGIESSVIALGAASLPQQGRAAAFAPARLQT